MSDTARMVLDSVLLAWGKRLIEPDHEETARGDSADIGEAGFLLTVLDDIGRANGAIRS